MQDPMLEFSQLCTTEDDLMCLKLHPLQVNSSNHYNHVRSSVPFEITTLSESIGYSKQMLTSKAHYLLSIHLQQKSIEATLPLFDFAVK